MVKNCREAWTLASEKIKNRPINGKSKILTNISSCRATRFNKNKHKIVLLLQGWTTFQRRRNIFVIFLEKLSL
jgi:hypothetical protein